MKGSKGAKGKKGSGRSDLAKGIDLGKLNRVQLLELLCDAMEENRRLESELAEANRKLDDRRIALEDSESLAEAALRLAGLFADAQHAIDLYGYNVALRHGEAQHGARASGDKDAAGDAEASR